MSTFYGGRAEVHLRRVISRVLYCDFTSMYPTVCTLMRLWEFVTAQGMKWRETTIEARGLLEDTALSDLQRPEFWGRLHAIVQVQPDADIFPVRAKYHDQPQYTIGLNYVTGDFPMWFTLADCIASKLLTGKSPKVIRAYTFFPGEPQWNLWPVNIAGNPAYLVEPSQVDFYKRLVELRFAVREQERQATGADKARLAAEQLALKILANVTSYGIFVELNVEDLPAKQILQRFGATGKSEPISTDKIEEPGEWFHPLVGTLITGAARLMLAIAETLAKQSGLDWAFCDTDSMAIAKPANMSDLEFYKRAQSICEWFAPLNYAVNVPLFKIEDENKRPVVGQTSEILEPLFCYAISAKRYALFNLDRQGKPIIRKASRHGLGHLLPPYQDNSVPDGFPPPATELEDLRRWQHDLWYRIVGAVLADRDGSTNPAAHVAFDRPVASPYHATTPVIWGWFDIYNHAHPAEKEVRPFNFLLALQMHPMAAQPSDEEDAAKTRNRNRRLRSTQKAKPVAPYDPDPLKAARKCFDRLSGKRIPIDDLETYREALAQYHLYPETKFLNGRRRDHGPTVRRHVKIGDRYSLHRQGSQRIGRASFPWLRSRSAT